VVRFGPMKAYVVWMDHNEAKLFKFQVGGKVEPTHVKRHEHAHHTHGDESNHKNEEKYFHEIIHQLEGASEVLVVGPGLAKTHFKGHLEKHKHGNLLKSIVGVETMDHPSDNEIVAQARKFFKNYDLFH
jgi:stalled ribosome rescue protein Dom34